MLLAQAFKRAIRCHALAPALGLAASRRCLALRYRPACRGLSTGATCGVPGGSSLTRESGLGSVGVTQGGARQ
jgi:hypothetical protein